MDELVGSRETPSTNPEHVVERAAGPATQSLVVDHRAVVRDQGTQALLMTNEFYFVD